MARREARPVSHSPMNTRAIVVVSVLGALLCVARMSFAGACEPPKQVTEATPQKIKDIFASNSWRVMTFLGYSGAEYEDPAAMLKHVNAALDKLDPKRTVVNIGATPQGIGAVYEVAKRRGFQTTGIVSTQAKAHNVALSPCVDFVFYVNDSSWGGYLPDGTSLSPTSEAMVTSSDILIAIGGGDVARDELLAAKRLGKRVTFIPADMNHRLAREKAARKGLPEPKDYRGSAHVALAGRERGS